MGHYAYTLVAVTICMVSRSTVAVSLVIVVALFAGCSGLVGDGGADSPDEFDYADGFSADGVTDTEAAANSYRQALANTSSYTIDYQQNISGPDSTLAYDVGYRVDVEGERAYHRVDVPAQNYEAEAYYGSDQVVTREVESGEETIRTQPGGFDLDNLTGGNAISPLLSNTTAYETSVEERGGTSVVVYEMSGTENAGEIFQIGEQNVTSFSASLAVDSDGLVRTANYDLTYVEGGEEQTVTLTFELVDVDSTTVERPDWVDQA